jgi:hypothetical protein
MIRSRTTRALGVAVVTGVLAVMLVPAAPAIAGAKHSPSPREGSQMAYDAADGQVVLFGGYRSIPHRSEVYVGDTWTWDGTDWTRQHPAHEPPARAFGGMVYDAGLGQVVLFGGETGSGRIGDLWTWNGTDWAEQHPVHSPSGRSGFGMAYDAARDQIVVFGGATNQDNYIDETWTWDGTDWTQRSPAHTPGRRTFTSMTYDAARGLVVLFGGSVCCFYEGRDTWTWDGSDWSDETDQNPPPARTLTALAYDDTLRQVIMFGGRQVNSRFDDTWAWDGSHWTQQQPAQHPRGRQLPAMAYDAAIGRVMLFGGTWHQDFGDTWNWDGASWTQVPAPSFTVSPGSGHPGTMVRVKGWSFAAHEQVNIFFVDSVSGRSMLAKSTTAGGGAFNVVVKIPKGSTRGTQHIKVNGVSNGQSVKAKFTVT